MSLPSVAFGGWKAPPAPVVPSCSPRRVEVFRSETELVLSPRLELMVLLLLRLARCFLKGLRTASVSSFGRAGFRTDVAELVVGPVGGDIDADLQAVAGSAAPSVDEVGPSVGTGGV